jgi:hypothetical protein
MGLGFHGQVPTRLARTPHYLYAMLLRTRPSGFIARHNALSLSEVCRNASRKNEQFLELRLRVPVTTKSPSARDQGARSTSTEDLPNQNHIASRRRMAKDKMDFAQQNTERASRTNLDATDHRSSSKAGDLCSDPERIR